MSKASKKAQAQGFGESQPFIAEPGAIEAGAIDWSQVTVNGQPIPDHLWSLVPYAQTDQGRLEDNAGKEPSRVSITRTEESKRIERFADFQFDGADPGFGDPMKELVDKHVGRDEHPRFLSEKAFASHGTRGYEKVLDEAGRPVKFGDMWLGVIPKHEAERREKRDAAISQQQMIDAQDKVRDQSDEIMSEGKMRSLARRKGVSEDLDGVQAEDVGEIQHEFVGQ